MSEESVMTDHSDDVNSLPDSLTLDERIKMQRATIHNPVSTPSKSVSSVESSPFMSKEPLSSRKISQQSSPSYENEMKAELDKWPTSLNDKSGPPKTLSASRGSRIRMSSGDISKLSPGFLQPSPSILRRKSFSSLQNQKDGTPPRRIRTLTPMPVKKNIKMKTTPQSPPTLLSPKKTDISKSLLNVKINPNPEQATSSKSYERTASQPILSVTPPDWKDQNIVNRSRTIPVPNTLPIQSPSTPAPPQVNEVNIKSEETLQTSMAPSQSTSLVPSMEVEAVSRRRPSDTPAGGPTSQPELKEQRIQKWEGFIIEENYYFPDGKHFFKTLKEITQAILQFSACVCLTAAAIIMGFWCVSSN